MSDYKTETDHLLHAVMNDIKAITEKAILFTSRNEIPIVEKLISVRKKKLERFRSLLDGRELNGRIKKFYKDLLCMDKDLENTLSELRDETGRLLIQVENSKKLRSRFVSAKGYQSRFIDRKI